MARRWAASETEAVQKAGVEYDADTETLYAGGDGFESGDVSEWSYWAP